MPADAVEDVSDGGFEGLEIGVGFGAEPLVLDFAPQGLDFVEVCRWANSTRTRLGLPTRPAAPETPRRGEFWRCRAPVQRGECAWRPRQRACRGQRLRLASLRGRR